VRRAVYFALPEARFHEPLPTPGLCTSHNESLWRVLVAGGVESFGHGAEPARHDAALDELAY